MKSLVARHNGKGFTGIMPDEETYEKVKDDEYDWKPHVKSKITHYTIPATVFERLVQLDRDREEAEYRDV